MSDLIGVALQRGWLLEWSALSCSYWSSWFSLSTLLMPGMKSGSANMRTLSPKPGWLVCQFVISTSVVSLIYVSIHFFLKKGEVW